MRLPQSGEEFEGNYQLHEVLGEGGFATVFLATELGSKRQVAIKLLKPDKMGRYSADIAPRFKREVRMLSQLTSPHTVTLFRHGKTSDGLLYLVFEHVPGQDLDELMHTRRLTATETLLIVRQVLEALRDAHHAGLLHRDIKPANIRVTSEDGELSVKLLDFGLAKPVFGAPAAQLTKTGEMVGTPRYMSPEQLTEAELTPASDLYSLGMVAYEMLSGGDMHGGRWSDQLDRLDSGHVFSIPELERIGPAVNDLIERMSARRPMDRFQSADQVLQALDDIEAGRTTPERARPSLDEIALARGAAPTAPEIDVTPPQQTDRRPTSTAALAIVVALLAMCVAVFFVLSSPEEPQRPKPPRRAAEEAPQTPQPSAAPDRRDPVVEHNPSLALPVATSSAGCGEQPPFYGTGDLHYMDGLSRVSWTVHIPNSYDPGQAHPLMVLLHPDITTPARIIERTGFDALADQHGFVILAPQDDLIRAWFDESSDHVILPRIIDTADRLCLNPRRIYMVAHGVGGYAVERQSCQPWLAGAVTNAFRRRGMPRCPNDRPVPFMHLSPVDSDRIPVAGGTGCHGLTTKPPLAEFEESWRTRNGCAESKTTERHGDHICYSWDSCKEEFMSCHIRGGFGWPGSGQTEKTIIGCEDGPPGDFPASQAAWEFLKRQTLSDEATPAW